MRKPSRIHVLVIAVVTIAVVVAALSVPPIIESIAHAGGVPVSAVARADRQLAYAGENISFSSAGSAGEIANYTWNFSDGNTSSDPEPVHAYEFPGWYNVTLTLTGREGGTDSCNLTVGIQRANESMDCDSARLYEIRPNWLRGTGMSFFIGPNIENPELAVEFDLSNGIGTFRLDIRVYIYDEDHSGVIEALYIETMTLTREDYHFNRTFPPAAIPPGSGVNRSEVRAIFWIDEGTWSGLTGTMSASFSIEGLRAEPAG